MSLISRSGLCVTEGEVLAHGTSGLSVDVPKMRAYVNQPAADRAQIHFTYLGPTATRSALGSGASRVQFGLKLHSADACNLVYVMWRIEPESKLVVSVKSNPGQHSSSQCSNHGYQNIKARSSLPAPPLTAGQSHTLRATLRADELQAFIDDRLVWQGSLGPIAASMQGSAGIRSDNARLQFNLESDHASPNPTSRLPGCRTGPEESE